MNFSGDFFELDLLTGSVKLTMDQEVMLREIRTRTAMSAFKSPRWTACAISCALLSSAIILGAVHVLDSRPLKRDARIRALRMNVFACGARLTWHTYGATRSFIQYGKNFGRSTKPAAKPRTDHEAELHGLKPGATYSFRIIVRRPGSTKFSLTYKIKTRAPRDFLVPEKYTLTEALRGAGACDTVRVGPGTYPGGIRVGPRVRLIGAGFKQTILDGRGVQRVVTLSHGSVLKGFTVRNSGKGHWDSGVWFTGSASPYIQGNRIENNSMGIAHYCWDACRSGARIVGNIIARNLREGLHLEKAAATVSGNTIYGNDRGLYIRRRGIRVFDNIIAANKRAGAAGVFLKYDLKNNILHDNGPRTYYPPGESPDERVNQQSGSKNLLLNPLLRNAPRGDFRLGAGSPARKAGGGGRDLGALPFRPEGKAPRTPRLNAKSGVKSKTHVLRYAPGRHFLYLAAGTKHYSRRIAAQGSETVLRGLPAGVEIRVALSFESPRGESELSPPVRFSSTANTPGLFSAGAWNVRLDGDWKTVRLEPTEADSSVQTEQPGARLLFEFQGESLVLYRTMGPHGGSADILVDGVFRGSLSFRFPEIRHRVPAVFDHLGPGAHRLEVRVRPGGPSVLHALRFPAPYEFTPIESRALKRVNFHRLLAGLAPLRPTWSLQLAARAHSRYFLRHRRDKRLQGLGFHREYPGPSGFTGANAAARGTYFGFEGTATEAGHFTGDPLWAVDGWMSTVYHRAAIMDYTATLMGYGSAGDENFRVDTLNTGHGPARPRPYPSRRLIYTYPAHKQLEVPHDWDGAEVPDPLPGRSANERTTPVGYPLSLYIVHPRGAKARDEKRRTRSNWRVRKFTLRDSRGQSTPVHMLDAKTDPHGVLKPGTVFLIPRSPLKLGERYTARVTGVDVLGAPFNHGWSFRVRGAGAVTSMYAEPAACQALLRWRSTGTVKSYLEYAGPGESFRRFFPSHGARGAFFARIYDLRPATTYRWRVVTITPGRNRTSILREFTTRKPRVLDVPRKYKSIPAAFKAVRACDVIRVGPGTYPGPLRLPRGVTLRGADPRNTFLRGNGKGSVLRITNAGTVSGFTITGSGRAYWDSGVWIEDARGVVVRGNRIRDNANGIVQYCFRKPCRASALVENNLLRGNSRRGIYIRSGAARIIENTIHAPAKQALETAPGTSIMRRGNRIRGEQ